MVSGNVRILQLHQKCVRMRQEGVRMASGWRQDASGGVRQASEVCQGSGVGVRSTSQCVRMRQEGVRVASGRRQDNLASGWRQDDVKRRGARIKWRTQISRSWNKKRKWNKQGVTLVV